MRVIRTPHGASHPVELKAVIEALRSGLTFFVTRDGEDCQCLFVLEERKCEIGTCKPQQIRLRAVCIISWAFS